MSAEFEAIYIEKTMLILIRDSDEVYENSKYYNCQSIVGKYNYETDELTIEIPSEYKEEFRKECRAAFEAEMMDKALR